MVTKDAREMDELQELNAALFAGGELSKGKPRMPSLLPLSRLIWNKKTFCRKK